MANLIGEPTMRSDRFATLWAGGEVSGRTVGDPRLRHPTLGALSVTYQVCLQPDSPDHRLELCTPHDIPTADALRVLAQRVAVDRPAGREDVP
ncbi:hypothetical protein ACFC5T_19405 [Streptomyces sp. NPDC055961]|uniref:MmyB family transcriptional regulator n=1 Tax=unclassified Streptomyces TaxID=2593676 RepID=UPI0035DDA260